MEKHKPSEIIEDAKNSARHEEYDKAMVLLAKIPKSYQLSCSELIFKSRIIQLSNRQDIYSLEDSEKTLKEALNMEPNNIEALLEMGHFQSNVNDNANAAKHFLKKAEELCLRYLNEIKKELNDL